MAIPTSSPIFDRGKSGYVRDFNGLDVFVFNVMGFALGLALSTNPAFIGGFAPSANIVTVVLLGAILALANGLTYGWFGGMMPTTGGDFIFVGRSLNHCLGFLANWGFTFCQIYGFSINIGWIISVGLAPTIISLGVSLADTSLIHAGIWLARPDVTAVGSIVLIGLYFLLAIFEAGFNRWFIYPAFALGLLGPIMIGWTLYAHTHSEFIASFNALMHQLAGTEDAYHLAISIAQGSGMLIDPHKAFAAAVQALPLGFLCFLGFTYSVYVGGEVERPEKSQIRGILGALALGVVAFAVCMGRYVDIVGQDFHSAIGFAAVSEKLQLPTNAMNFIVSGLAEKSVANVLMQVGTLVWFILVPYVMLQVCVHNFVAWGCDRLMPQAILWRSSRTNTHWVAVSVVCVLAALAVLANYSNGFTLVGAAALAAGAFFLTGIAAWELPHKRPDVFEKGPRWPRTKLIGDITLFQVCGGLSALGFAWVIYAAVCFSDVASGTPEMATIMLVGVYCAGFVWYHIFRQRVLRQAEASGIDLSEFFKEIPDD